MTSGTRAAIEYSIVYINNSRSFALQIATCETLLAFKQVVPQSLGVLQSMHATSQQRFGDDVLEDAAPRVILTATASVIVETKIL